MSWDETTRMTQRVRFISDLARDLYTMTELCERYGISRKTGYKWVQRHSQEGYEGLRDRSSARNSQAKRTPQEIEEALVELRRTHVYWGPRKLLKVLRQRQPKVDWPAASTVGAILKRHGLVEGRRPARRRWPSGNRAPLQPASSPNQSWSSDFKGQFRMGDGRLCYPLTVMDGYSRFLLGVDSLESVSEGPVWLVFERLFREYGLPEGIRTDNGIPFASAAVAGLSRLSVKWIKLGIRLERIMPGHPEQNGRHERMHRTLKQETARPAAADRSAQQESFDRFRHLYNEHRPHQALDQRTPSELYRPSERFYPGSLPEPEYPGHFEVRSVRPNGEIKWQGEYLYLSEALIGERVGLEERDEGVWSVFFGAVLLGRFDEREGKLVG
jgi:putative transposase